MKKIICLYGGPGTGKSTTAAHLFARLKQRGANTELVTEYVKNWVWEKRKIRTGDQYYLFAKQARSERMKFDDVDVIITDAPIWLSSIYEKKFEPAPHVCDILINKHVQLAKEAGFEYKHIFLNRIKPYNQAGRYQTEEEAKVIDTEILEHLTSIGEDVITVVGNDQAADNIILALGL